MDSKKYLIDQIRKCKRKMNLAKIMDSGCLYAAAGGVFGMFCEFVSLFREFYYAVPAAVLCFGAGLFAGICHAVYRRADMKRAAGRLDSFGLKERMLTAYENMDREDEFARLQRQDALLHYDRMRERIRIPLLPDKRHILALIVSIAAVTGMCFIPSPVREQAKLRHQVQEQAAEEKEELEKFLDALEGVDMESLTKQQRAELQELLDMMELSREELAGANSWESLSAATQRLDYKYGQAAQSLEQLALQTAHPEVTGLAGAEALAKAAADQNRQLASTGTPGQDPGEGEGRDGENGSGGEEGQSGGNGLGGQEGQSGGSSSGGQQGQGGGNSPGGQQDQSGGNNPGGQEGQGGGSSPGGQEGQGGENGSGGGSGQGDGSEGNGRGTGSSDAAHDYVSIPNAVSDDSSLTGNKNGDQNSDYYRGQNGLAWEGDHVDYSSVIGEYTDSAYEGIANGRYPSGMEAVIRDYFENLNK